MLPSQRKSGMRKRNGKLMRLLGGVMALAALVVAGLVLYAYKSGLLPPKPPPVMEPSPAAGDALVMREDIMPEKDSFYKVWDLSFIDLKGRSVSLSDLRGKPLALMYWNSWCPDCKKTIAGADQAAQAANMAGGQLVLVAREGVKGETAGTAAGTLSSMGIAQTTLLDPGGSAYGRIGLIRVPTILYFRSDGTLMYADTEVGLSPDAIRAGLDYAENGGRAATEAFVRDRLLSAQGRVSARFTVEGDGRIKPADESLSESQGLAMRYALVQEDQPLFDMAYEYVRSSMSVNNLAAWHRKGDVLEDVNATIDDLRIAGALKDAQEAWGGYEAELAVRAGALKRVLANGYPVDYIQLHSSGRAPTLTLCYGDLTALRKLADAEPAFSGVADNVQALMLGGRLSQAFPLYYPRYDFEKARYDGGEIHAAEAMLTLLHLAQDGALPDDTRDFLIRWVREGAVYARYAVQGVPVPGYEYESTATYAMMVMIGCELHDDALIRPALYRMERLRSFGPGGENGAYVGEAENYTFDTLYALLAWQALEEEGFPGAVRD